MTPFVLRPRERQVLEELTLHPPTAQSLRRAQALWWLDEGESVQEVAERLQISRQAVYQWITHFHTRSTLPITARVADGRHPGRPRTVWGVIDPLLDAVIDSPPGTGATKPPCGPRLCCNTIWRRAISCRCPAPASAWPWRACGSAGNVPGII